MKRLYIFQKYKKCTLAGEASEDVWKQWYSVKASPYYSIISYDRLVLSRGGSQAGHIDPQIHNTPY